MPRRDEWTGAQNADTSAIEAFRQEVRAAHAVKSFKTRVGAQGGGHRGGGLLFDDRSYVGCVIGGGWEYGPPQ